MVKETATRRRPSGQELYLSSMRQQATEAERAASGKRLLKGKEIPFEQDQQGIRRIYTHFDLTDNALNDFMVFAHEVRTKSGRHTHQGGLCIFVIKGRGYSIVDGVRHDWQAGDVIMLPIKKGGVDHQHFNLGSKPAIWMALVSYPMQRFVGQRLVQNETSPTWQKR